MESLNKNLGVKSAIFIFNLKIYNPQYRKKFVHQIHCGTKSGKSLVDYVVPDENKGGCFFIREEITVGRVEKELKNKGTKYKID